MTRMENVDRVAQTMYDAGFRLPKSLGDVGELVCSVKGCKPEGQSTPFKALMYQNDKKTSDLVLVLNQFVPPADRETGRRRRPIPVWWVNVTTPLVNGALAPVCRFHSNEERRAKAEELSATIGDELLKMARRILSDDPRGWLAKKLTTQSNTEKISTMSWQHDEVRSVNSCVPLHEAFRRLATLERAEGDETTKLVLDRESEIVECCMPNCDFSAEIRRMKALALVTVSEGESERKQYFTLEYLLSEMGETKISVKIRESLIASHRDDDGRISPVWLCSSCARALLATLTPSGQWSLTCSGRDGEYTRPLYENAIRVVRRLAKAELRERDRGDHAQRNAERRAKMREASTTKLGEVLGLALSKDKMSDTPSVVDTPQRQPRSKGKKGRRLAREAAEAE